MMKIRLLGTLSIICALFIAPVFSQDMSNIAFINRVADKEVVTYGDAVKFFVLTTGKKAMSFKKNLNYLKRKGIIKHMGMNAKAPVRKGALSLMISRYLKLGDSLLYMIFKTERYAFRACVANNIIEYNGSEWEKVSGGEFVEIMTNVAEWPGEKK